MCCLVQVMCSVVCEVAMSKFKVEILLLLQEIILLPQLKAQRVIYFYRHR